MSSITHEMNESSWELDYSKTGVVIGLEIHLQLNLLKTKLFCNCDAQYRGEDPNTHCCPVCVGLPGTLPVINGQALAFASRLALAMNAEIQSLQFFFRKNYYYPDMARNFQISQYNRGGGVPYASGGQIAIKTPDQQLRMIRLDRMHLEDDPGKLTHKGGNFTTSPYTLVDYNRCGTALIEIVTKPELYSPEETRTFLNKLRAIITHLDISDISQDGAFRVDANISLENSGRVEIKNIGSVRDVEKALRWEIFRQRQEIKKGGKIPQETRAWNGKQTILLRTKEEEDDYRYFPEPDLVPFSISSTQIEAVKSKLPELPDARMVRLMVQYQLSEYDADVLVSDKYNADFFENCAKKTTDYKLLVNWLCNDIQGRLNDAEISLNQTKLTPKLLLELMDLVERNIISTKMAKSMIPMIIEGKSSKSLVKAEGFVKITDSTTLDPICEKVIKENPAILKDLAKKPKAFMSLVGKVMAETHGKADSEVVQQLLARKISFDLSLLEK